MRKTSAENEKDELKVSAIITCWNDAQTLEKAYASIAWQTRPVDEIIFVDDGSTDDTAELVRRIQAGDTRVRFLGKANGGVSSARNHGITHASGDYIAFLDADDEWLPGKIETQLIQAELHPHAAIIYGDFLFQSETNERRKHVRVNRFQANENSVLSRFFSQGGPILNSCALIRKSVFHELGLYDETVRRCEDVDMWLRIVAQHPVQWVEGPLIIKHGRSGSLGAFDPGRLRDIDRVLRKFVRHHPELRRHLGRRRAKACWLVARHEFRHGDYGRALLYAIGIITSLCSLNSRLFDVGNSQSR